MIKEIIDIDDDYLIKIEDEIKKGVSLNTEEVNYFLQCLMYLVRMKIFSNDCYFEFKCDLAQSIICHYLNDLNVTNYPNMTINAIGTYITGHSFVVATFLVDGRMVNYLLDPTYIQFFRKENISDDKYIVFNGVVIRTPDPGYFIKNEDKAIIDELNYNGFGVLTNDLARAYGNSFYNTKTMVHDKMFQEIGGDIYINAFLKGRENLSKSRDELMSSGMYIFLEDYKKKRYSNH